jgi:hypothetical protein
MKQDGINISSWLLAGIEHGENAASQLTSQPTSQRPDRPTNQYPPLWRYVNDVDTIKKRLRSAYLVAILCATLHSWRTN